MTHDQSFALRLALILGAAAVIGIFIGLFLVGVFGKGAAIIAAVFGVGYVLWDSRPRRYVVRCDVLGCQSPAHDPKAWHPTCVEHTV